MVVLVLASVSISVAGITAQRNLRYGNRLARQARQRASLARLARQVRRDIHTAQAVTAVPGAAARGDTVRCRTAEGRVIEYRIDHERAVRTERRADRPVRRDAFQVPRGSVLHLDVSGPAGRRLAAVRICWPEVAAIDEPASSVATCRWVVESLIARDHRWNAPRPDGAPRQGEEARP